MLMILFRCVLYILKEPYVQQLSKNNETRVEMVVYHVDIATFIRLSNNAILWTHFQTFIAKVNEDCDTCKV